MYMFLYLVDPSSSFHVAKYHAVNIVIHYSFLDRTLFKAPYKLSISAIYKYLHPLQAYTEYKVVL